MESDINSLTGRRTELETQDVLEAGLARHGIDMKEFDPQTIITIGAPATAVTPLAQN
jgi:hypothetical protein